MFRLPGRKREAKDRESRAPEEEKIAEVPGDNGNGKKLADLLNELVEQRQASPSASVRSIIKAAINSAEHIADSVKTRALEEARQEAAKIIVEAQREAERIKEAKMPVQEETVAGTIPGAEEAGGERVEETRHTREQAFQLQQEAGERIIEAEMPQQEERASVEAVAEEEASGKSEAAEEAERKEPEIMVTKEERESVYSGEVQLNVEPPLEPTMVSKLYNFLQTTPEIKFIRTTGSWNRGSIITLMLDKPIPLFSVLAAKLPEAGVAPERPEAGGQVKGRQRIRRISISLKSK
jgi:hypothetical protein